MVDALAHIQRVKRRKHALQKCGIDTPVPPMLVVIFEKSKPK
jgi:hypothetical protein